MVNIIYLLTFHVSVLVTIVVYYLCVAIIVCFLFIISIILKIVNEFELYFSFIKIAINLCHCRLFLCI